MSDDLVERLREWWEYDHARLIEKSIDRIEELEAKLAKDDKAHEKELAVWDENYAALERKLSSAKAALPHAYCMGLEDAASRAKAAMEKHAKETYSKETVKVFTKGSDTHLQSAAKTYCAGEILEAIRAIPTPTDLVERAMKETGNE